MVKHIPVMLNHCLEQLSIKKDGTYVDLTLGRGGHSSEILKRIPKGLLVSFDKDIEAINESGNRLSQISDNYILIHSDNRFIKEELKNNGIEAVDGILLDLGVSSPQLDNAERGFSYNKESRLDMRMDRSQELDAHKIINSWSETQLINILYEYADVKFARQIAKAVIENRPIDTTTQLVDLLRETLPAKIVRKKNPAKPVFQAIRIAVNNEMDSLKQALNDGLTLLKTGGKFAVITFHSIEDRIVKKFFGNLTKDKTGKLPIQLEKEFSVKTIKAKDAEIDENRRARSAKLRVITKLR
ncbi:MAG: 16S rRNA (cytosine(1402)-N(4))-methyltransferase RsmH [Mycoplasma sp.]|nr:16S rRNA (cytosine(1402)-N(4))-methyltransferase RsmH [Mycoplasma sp.]